MLHIQSLYNKMPVLSGEEDDTGRILRSNLNIEIDKQTQKDI